MHESTSDYDMVNLLFRELSYRQQHNSCSSVRYDHLLPSLCYTPITPHPPPKTSHHHIVSPATMTTIIRIIVVLPGGTVLPSWCTRRRLRLSPPPPPQRNELRFALPTCFPPPPRHKSMNIPTNSNTTTTVGRRQRR